jgi:hypothetical protein
MKHMTNEQGKCLVCGEEIEYGSGSADGNTYGYDWTCEHCHATGVEVYNLTFSSQVLHNNPDWGALVRTFRKQRKMKQKVLAALVHISARQLRRYESCETEMRLDRFALILYHMHCDVSLVPR